jgi:hypothetical protein
MQITDAKIQALEPKEKPYKVSIGGGAYLLVRPDGKKYWRLKYHFDGKESVTSLGVFPETSFVAAMVARNSTKALLRKGVNPVIAKRQAKRQAISREPLFRLTLSSNGCLSIETDTHALVFTTQQTQALVEFLCLKPRQ